MAKVVKKYKSNVLAQWYTKQFYVSQSEMNTFMNFSASHSYNYEEKEDGNKMPGIDKKHVENGSVSFEIPLRTEWCKDIRKEYEWWRNQCNVGRESLLYIGTAAFGSYNYIIESVELKDVKLSNTGIMIACSLNVKFKESPKSKKLTKKKRKKIGMGAKTRNTVVNKKGKKYTSKTTYKFSK